MKYFVEVKNNRVYTDTEVAGDFPSEPPITRGEWVEATDVVPRPTRNWLYVNGEFLPPVMRSYIMIQSGKAHEMFESELLITDVFPPEFDRVEVTDWPKPWPVLGSIYNGDGTFSPPPPPPNTAPQLKVDMINYATVQIAILTDAVDPEVVDEIDPADAALLLLWKKYRQALRTVDTSAHPVVWPAQPPLPYTNKMGGV